MARLRPNILFFFSDQHRGDWMPYARRGSGGAEAPETEPGDGRHILRRPRQDARRQEPLFQVPASVHIPLLISGPDILQNHVCASLVQLYDLLLDADEAHNIAEEAPALLRKFQTLLAGHFPANSSMEERKR